MDKRSIITTIAFTLVMMGIIGLMRYAQTRYPPIATTPTPTAPSATPSGPQTPGTAAASTSPATAQATATGWQVMTAPTSGPVPQPVSLGSAVPDDRTYAMQLNVNPTGAGLSSVVLNQFKSSQDFSKPMKERRLYVYQTPANAPPSDSDALATRRVEITNGGGVDLYDADWSLEATTSSTQPAGGLAATYSITLSNNGTPGLKIFKTFTISPISSASQGYEVGVDYKLQNLSSTPLTVKLIYNGPTLPPQEGGRGADRQILSGYRQEADIAIDAHPIEDLKKDKQTLELSKNDKGPLAWTGTCSVYFNALVLPLKDDPNGTGNSAVGDYIDNVTARGWMFENSDVAADNRPVTLAFTTTSQALSPGQTVRLPSAVYFGPRSRDVLKTSYYEAPPRHYDETLVIKSGWWICTFFTSEHLINVMVFLLSCFHWVAGGFCGHGDWGIAIILLVGVVRLLLHPITKRSQVQMMKMGKMGPEMERLKKKYADDKDELNRQMMQFYKAQGAAPILGCLPMFLQMPIWIALYSSLQSTFALRQSPFLWNLTWIHDLSKPDYLLYFPNHPIVVPFVGWHINGLNLLPLLLGVVFFLQQKYMTPPNPAMSEDQLKQQKMMQYMTPLIFPIMMYNMPSGLNLYIFASTLFGVIESRIIRKHIKEREEAEKAGRVIVDAKPTRQGKQLARAGTTETAPAGGLRGFWANLQAKAEEARREQDRKRKNGRK